MKLKTILKEAKLKPEIVNFAGDEHDWIATIENDFTDLDLSGRWLGSCFEVSLHVAGEFARMLTEDECALLDTEVENAVDRASDAIMRERWLSHRAELVPCDKHSDGQLAQEPPRTGEKVSPC